MMNTQAASLSSAGSGRLPVGAERPIAPGQAIRLGHRGGELTVVSGRVWMTRRGDLGDHVFGPGQRVRLDAAEDAVVETWDARQTAVVRWNPRQRSFLGALLAEPLRGAAFLTGRLAAGCAALARTAAAGAVWAQGRVSGTN